MNTNDMPPVHAMVRRHVGDAPKYAGEHAADHGLPKSFLLEVDENGALLDRYAFCIDLFGDRVLRPLERMDEDLYLVTTVTDWVFPFTVRMDDTSFYGGTCGNGPKRMLVRIEARDDDLDIIEMFYEIAFVGYDETVHANEIL